MQGGECYHEGAEKRHTHMPIVTREGAPTSCEDRSERQGR